MNAISQKHTTGFVFYMNPLLNGHPQREFTLKGERGSIGDGGDATPGYPVLVPWLNVDL
jgi:hypothetical protein